MRHLLIVLILISGFAWSENPSPGAAKPSKPEQTHAGNGDDKSANLQGNPEKSPLVVNNVFQSPEYKARGNNDTQQCCEESPGKGIWEAIVAIATMILAGITGYLVLYTKNLWGATVSLGKDSKETSERQAREMKESLAIADRSATSMADVAKATRDNAALVQGILHKQIRAYIAVDIGVPTYQNGNVRFETAPVMENTGFTPARKVSHRVKTGILSTILPADFVFDDSAPWNFNDAVLAPRQKFVFHSTIDHLFQEAEVLEIMQGENKRLFVWGTISYEDIFDNKWETNFCHNFIFFKATDSDGVERVKYFGYYHRTHNNAT